jgi:hypothetical protein
MKKVFAIFGSLLIFAGLKAQTPAPAVKKETIKPGTVQPPVVNADTAKNAAFKQTTNKAIKFDHIKKAPTVQMKESPAQVKLTPSVVKPHKD